MFYTRKEMDLYKEGKFCWEDFAPKFVSFYDFDRKKLDRIAQDGEESNEMSEDLDVDDWNLSC